MLNQVAVLRVAQLKMQCLFIVKPVRRACARGWTFGQNASLTHVASRQSARSASQMQSCWLDKPFQCSLPLTISFRTYHERQYQITRSLNQMLPNIVWPPRALREAALPPPQRENGPQRQANQVLTHAAARGTREGLWN